jgi:glycine/sarcosine N-methyltransferase
MDLYTSLAPVYDELFPLPAKSTAFLDSLFPLRGAAPHSSPRRALDAGCATGTQALDLARLGWSVIGMDSDASMIERARQSVPKAGEKGEVAFEVGDILGVGDRFPRESFELVLCLGNTLPHLIEGGAASFIAQSRGMLAPGGAIVLQLINFSHPSVGPGYAFPELSGGGATMRRSYESAAPERPQGLRFIVELSRDGRTSEAETLLEPLPPRSVADMIRESGFSEPEFYSSWAGTPFREDTAFLLIALARVLG